MDDKNVGKMSEGLVRFELEKRDRVVYEPRGREEGIDMVAVKWEGNNKQFIVRPIQVKAESKTL